jgi:hypothetical protein
MKCAVAAPPLVRVRRDFSPYIGLGVYDREAFGVLIHMLEQKRCEAPVSILSFAILTNSRGPAATVCAL